MIEAIAETLSGLSSNQIIVNIERRPDGVYVDNIKATGVTFNGIQLRLIMPDGTTYILFDGRSASTLSIKEMYQQLTDAPSRG